MWDLPVAPLPFNDSKGYSDILPDTQKNEVTPKNSVKAKPSIFSLIQVRCVRVGAKGNHRAKDASKCAA